MTHTPYGYLPPSAASHANPLERLLGRVMGWLGWVVLMLLGLVFVVSLLFWLAVMVLYSLVAGWITGMVHSTAPARFISSRTMASTLRMTRNPMGM